MQRNYESIDEAEHTQFNLGATLEAKQKVITDQYSIIEMLKVQLQSTQRQLMEAREEIRDLEVRLNTATMNADKTRD